MKFSFVKRTKRFASFAEVVPDDKTVVLEYLLIFMRSLLVKRTKMSVQSHVRQKYLPS